MSSLTKTARIRVDRLSAVDWRAMFDNPPLDLMGLEFVRESRDLMIGNPGR